MDKSPDSSAGSREASLEAYRGRIARALAYVQDRIGGDVSLEGAAAAACFSKFHFHRIFAAATGESFADCVRRMRLERAANLLEHRPSMTVTEAAMASGFSSPSVLSRLFAERFGAPPSRWREERIAAARSAARWGAPEVGTEAPLNFWARGAADGVGCTELSLRRLPSIRFASCLHVGPYGPEIQEAWDRLCRWAGPRGLLGPGTRAAGVSWDNPDLCPPERCRYSACIEIPENAEPSGDVVLVAFPARDYLCLHFTGPERGLSAAYSELYRRHLPESGFEPEDDPAIEFYRSPVREDAFDLDIALPVRPLA